LGEPFFQQYLDRPKPVHKDQLVKLVMSSKGLEVTGKVRALQSGGYGQIINVIYPETKKIVRAKIINSGLVEYVY